MSQRCTRWTSGRLYSKSPTSRRLSGVCANAATGQTAAELPSNAMNSRRLMSDPKLRRQHLIGSNEYFDRVKPTSKTLPQCTANVSVGSDASVLRYLRYVRYPAPLEPS